MTAQKQNAISKTFYPKLAYFLTDIKTMDGFGKIKVPRIRKKVV